MKNDLSNATVDALLRSMSIAVVNYERNKELLQKLPHKRLLDLAVIIKWRLDSDNNEQEIPEFINVNNEMIEAWGVDADTLINIAMINSKRLSSAMLIPFNQFLFDEYSECDRIFVLTNSSLINGAALVCYEEILEFVYNRFEGDYYLIPSSVNEMLAFESDEILEIQMMKDVLKNVNSDVLSAEEFLSDNIYYYNGCTKTLKIV